MRCGFSTLTSLRMNADLPCVELLLSPSYSGLEKLDLSLFQTSWFDDRPPADYAACMIAIGKLLAHAPVADLTLRMERSAERSLDDVAWQSKSLKTLRFRSTVIDNEMLRPMRDLPAFTAPDLTTFEAHGVGGSVLSKTLASLARSPHLECLLVSISESKNQPEATQLVSLLHAGKWPSLTALELREGECALMLSLLAAKPLSSLRSITVESRHTHSHPEAITRFLRSHPKLQNAGIGLNTSTPAAAPQSAHSQPAPDRVISDLQSLYVSAATDSCFNGLSFPKLHTLKVGQNGRWGYEEPQLTSIGVIIAACPAVTDLTIQNVNFTNGVSDRSDIAASITRLSFKRISIGILEQTSPISLLSLFPNLTTLRINECDMVDTPVLLRIAHNRKLLALKELRWRFYRRVSDNEITMLTRLVLALPSLLELHIGPLTDRNLLDALQRMLLGAGRHVAVLLAHDW